MAVKTRADLIVSIARQMGHYATGTATSGSTSMLIDLKELYAPDGYWLNHYLYILTDAGGSSAAPEGEESLVTGYVQTTGKLSIDPVLSAAIATGDIYQLLPVRRADIVAAINTAIRTAGSAWPALIVDDATITFAANDYDYTLPATLAHLLSVARRTGAATPWIPVDRATWKVVKTPGAQEVVFKTLAGMASGDTIRLEYLAWPTEMATDTATLGIGEPAERELVEFVIASALFLLHDQAASAAPVGIEFSPHLTQAQHWKVEAERIRDRVTREAMLAAEPRPKGETDGREDKSRPGN